MRHRQSRPLRCSATGAAPAASSHRTDQRPACRAGRGSCEPALPLQGGGEKGAASACGCMCRALFSQGAQMCLGPERLIARKCIRLHKGSKAGGEPLCEERQRVPLDAPRLRVPGRVVQGMRIYWDPSLLRMQIPTKLPQPPAGARHHVAHTSLGGAKAQVASPATRGNYRKFASPTLCSLPSPVNRWCRRGAPGSSPRTPGSGGGSAARLARSQGARTLEPRGAAICWWSRRVHWEHTAARALASEVG